MTSKMKLEKSFLARQASRRNLEERIWNTMLELERKHLPPPVGAISPKTKTFLIVFFPLGLFIAPTMLVKRRLRGGYRCPLCGAKVRAYSHRLARYTIEYECQGCDYHSAVIDRVVLP